MEAYIGEIRTFGFGIIPRGWAACNGQPMPINQNQALFALLGTQYGGDGRTTFNLPNFQGKTLLGAGNANGLTVAVGNTGGEASVNLTVAQLPMHMHTVQVSDTTATANIGTGTNYLAQITMQNSAHTYFAANGYTPQPTNPVALASDTVSQFGGGQAHENRMPFLTLNVCICLTGYYPSRN